MSKSLLTVYALEEDIEDAVPRYCQFVLVKEAILDALLDMLIPIEVIVLQIVKKTAGYRTYAFNIVDSGGKF